MTDTEMRAPVRLGARKHEWRTLLRVENAAEPEKYSLVEVHCRPADALDMDIAKARVDEALRAFVSNSDTLINYGLEAFNRTDVIDGIENLIGASGFLHAVELAVLTADGVRGVEGADGQPIKATRPGFAELFRHSASPARGDLLCNRFMAIVLAPMFKVAEEGKGSATVQNISGAAQVADNSAKAAPKTGTPAPEAG